MMLSDIADYLEDQGAGTVGTDIFIGELPEKKNSCIALFQYSGEQPLDNNLDNIERPGLQVKVKNPDYSAGYTKIEAIQNLLDQQELTINGNYYPWIRAIQSPFPLGRDSQNNNALFAQNFIVYRRND